MCSTKIFRLAISSVSLKFGACYITGQLGYFRMKTATLWCLIDIPTLVNFSKFFELGHSYSTPPPPFPDIKFWEKLHFPPPPLLIRSWGFFHAPRLFQPPLLLGTKKHCMFSYTFLAFFSAGRVYSADKNFTGKTNPDVIFRRFFSVRLF